MIRVAIDTGPLKNNHKIRGIGMYTSELVNAVKIENKKTESIFKIDTIDFSKSDLSNFDLLHFTSFQPFQKTLLNKFSRRQKVVVTIHDLIQLIYPNIYQPGIKGKINFLYQKIALKNVSDIIVPSETSKKDVVRFLNVNPDSVKVIYEGVKRIYRKITDSNTLEKIRKKYKLPKNFVLYVGDINYNKNISSLIDACIEINIPLVICGKQALEVNDVGINLMNLSGPRDYFRFLFNLPHPELKHYFELSEKFSKNSKSIYRLGFVPDDDLAAIFNLASVYVQPSYYEGFGLPVLEAFASGIPVVVAKNNCLVEISGGAALVSESVNSIDIKNAINKVLKNSGLQRELIVKGFKRVKEFSWAKTAKETLSVYSKS